MRTVAAFAVLLLVAACQAPPAEMTEAERAQYEAEVRHEITAALGQYRDYVMNGDVEGVLSFWTSDARTLWPGTNLAGNDLRAFVAEVLPTMTITGYYVELLEVFVHGDVAYLMGEWSEAVGIEGQEPELQVSNCFTRLEKEDGVWKFDRDVCGPRDAPPEG